MQRLPQTEHELWSMLPPLAWTPRRRELVVEARLGDASWRTIGVLLGTSRQAPAQRFGAAVHDALEVSGDS